MNLSLFIYLATVVGNISSLFHAVFVIGCIAAVVGTFIGVFVMAELDGDERKIYFRHFRNLLISVFATGVLVAFIPNERTMYLMAGAYATEEIAKSPQAQAVGGKVLEVINQRLDEMLQKQEPKK